MKRKLITCLLAMTMAAGLAACGSTKTSTTSDNTKQGSTTDDAASDTSDESTDSNMPSEITPETLKDFPASESSYFDFSPSDENGNSEEGKTDHEKYGYNIYYPGPLLDGKDHYTKVIVVPSVISYVFGDVKVNSIGIVKGSDENSSKTAFWYVGAGSDTEAIVVSKDINYIKYLWDGNPPENLKYILLPKKFENTGLEAQYDPNNQLTWIYEDVDK